MIAIFVNNDLYINETVSQKKYLRPNLNKEIITGSKTSGTKATIFSSFTPMLQQFGFYRDFITFQGQGLQEMLNFISPIAKGAPKFYDYYIVDTLSVKGALDATFVVEYEPKVKSNISGLKGIMHINTDSYALEYVEAEPAQMGSIHMKLFQTYEKIQGTKRFF